MGLDVGSKTVGVALSDALRITAQALVTVRRTNQRDDLLTLRKLVQENEVTTLVVGLPLHMNGTEGDSAAAARKLGQALGEATQLDVIYWDERLTTTAAHRLLREANASRKKRKEVIDQVAAALILQGWLDSQVRSDE
jgi:putative Holliday junction resolvase